MAVISVTEDFRGLGSEGHSEPDGTKVGSGDRYFDVVFDAADVAANRPFIARSVNAVDPSTGVRVPQLGDSHPYDHWVYVVRLRTAVTDDSAFVFRVTVEHREISNPLDEPPIVEWLSASTMEPIDTDIDGNPILNSSDEPFDPPPTEEFYDLIMRATFNVANFDPVGASNYNGAVNIDWFRGFAPGLGKVKEYTSRQIWVMTGWFYVAVAVELRFRSTGWKRKFLDQGYRTKGDIVDGVQTYTQIKDTEGNLVTDPVLLDGLGQKLADGAPVVRREYWTKPQLSFNTEFWML